MSDKYFSLASASEGTYKEKGSRFYAFAWPVKSVEEAEEKIAGVWKQYHDARHVCYAYRIGIKGEPWRANDDGEPAHSAGDPILNELKSKEVSDAVVAVVRYFGGTKLGTSGLINAYREACRLAIESADIQEFYITRRIKIRFDYALMGQLMEIIKSLNYLAAESNYGEDPFLILEVRLSEFELAEKKIKAKFLHRSVEDIEEDTLVEGLGFDYP